MQSINYSAEALSVLTAFHKVQHVIFVEGEDDIRFWRIVFEEFQMRDCYFNIATGAKNLDIIADLIVNKDAEVLIARDRDYSHITKKQIDHPRILYTYGYSIENSLYTPRVISEIITTYSRLEPPYSSKDVEIWFDDFLECFNDLLVLDIANCIFEMGKSIMSDSIFKYLSNSKSINVDKQKIATRRQDLEKDFTKNQLEEVSEILSIMNIKKNFIVRGHFLAGIARHYINYTVYKKSAKKINISNDDLYSLAIQSFKPKKSKKDDKIFLRDQIEKIEAL